MQLLVLGLTPREEEALRCAFGTEFTMVFVSDPQKGKALLSDPSVIKWQIRFVKYFVSFSMWD